MNKSVKYSPLHSTAHTNAFDLSGFLCCVQLQGAECGFAREEHPQS